MMFPGVVLLVTAFVCLAQGQSYTRLYNELMDGLESTRAKDIIPIVQGQPLLVTFGLTITDLRSMDTLTGEAELCVWQYLVWTDDRLGWVQSQYEGVDGLRVSPQHIWTPDIVVFNGDMSTVSAQCVLYSSGTVYCIPATTVKTRCDVTEYAANGIVTCSITWASWSYDDVLLDLTIKMRNPMDTTEYLPGRWEISNTTIGRYDKQYTCCPENYPYIITTISFRDTHRTSTTN